MRFNSLADPRVVATVEAMVEARREMRYLYGLTDRLAALLTGVAEGLKGPPEPLSRHDTSSLPRLAREVRAAGVAILGEHPDTHAYNAAVLEIAQHLSMVLAWGLDPGTVDAAWCKRAIDELAGRDPFTKKPNSEDTIALSRRTGSASSPWRCPTGKDQNVTRAPRDRPHAVPPQHQPKEDTDG